LENFGKLNTRCAAAFWIHCKGLIAEAGSPTRRELQSSRRVMTSTWTKICAASHVRKGRIRQMFYGAILQDPATEVILALQDSSRCRGDFNVLNGDM